MRNPTVVTLHEIAQGLGVSNVELMRPEWAASARIHPPHEQQWDSGI